MKRALVLTLLFAAASHAATNPFFTKSTLQFQAPPFDRFKDSDYAPALEEGMKRQLVEIDAIANNAEPPTFANTIEALERSGELLTRVSKTFYNLTRANTNAALQKVEQLEGPKLAAHSDAIVLNPKLFARVKSLYDTRDTAAPNAEAKRLIERYYRNFVRSGALLSEEQKNQLRALNQEETKLNTDYRAKLLADTAASAVVVDRIEELNGLSASDIAAAAQEAKDRGLKNKWVLTLQNTTQQPQLGSLSDRALRTRLYNASVQRGTHGGENDVKAIVARYAQLRAERAKLMGYPTYAGLSLAEEMATPEKAMQLMTQLAAPATAKAREEAARIQQMIDTDDGSFQLGPQDWAYYAGRVQHAEYDVDESQVRPYFELDRVLRDGVFFAAHELYGLSFKERRDLPLYNPDVRAFEVFDADGKSLAIYYGDFFARANKEGGAWMDSFVDQSALLGTRSVVVNVCNFQKPAAGQPALLSFDDVTTIFHEFGHALHGILSNVRYPTFTGVNVPRDFGEVPSQFNEHWELEPKVLANYAKHYKTGAPMPKELVEKLKKASKFNVGYATTEYLASALLDMAWHTLPADAPLQDPVLFEKTSLKKFGIDLSVVPPRYHTAYFSHIWGSSYAAGYYAYLWSDVIDEDAWAWFQEHGGLTRENGQRFREAVLSRGGTLDAAEMYRAFRGHDPTLDPLLQSKGFK
jgi:peptidyl-dipeptidase Dcp